jgi:NADH-quinone oxidoreductase subunit I
MATPEPPRQRQNFLGGFKLTLEHLGRLPVTRQYPEEKRPKQPRQHGRHVLNRYEDGMEKCIGCELCAGVCPADCIYVRGLDNPPDDPVSPGERYGFIYEINFLRCIHCDLCVEACPTEAITESKMFEFSFTNRSDAIYTKEELLVDDEGMPKKLPWEDWREGDDLYTSGWMRATSPSGSAAYEGEVQWSGDLGYGVRSPEGGQSGKRDDTTTGSKPLRETLERHLQTSDLPAAKRGPRGAIGRMMEKAERFSPSASRKHKAKADADYSQALSAGNSDRGKTARAVADSLPGGPPDPAAPAAPDAATGDGQPDAAPDGGGR